MPHQATFATFAPVALPHEVVVEVLERALRNRSAEVEAASVLVLTNGCSTTRCAPRATQLHMDMHMHMDDIETAAPYRPGGMDNLQWFRGRRSCPPQHHLARRLRVGLHNV
ncbi:hypothetical protein ACK8N7_36080 [Streptomyces griseobrunneus]|uniref:hypothetical protein n=1 Tax=Streptomyces microflavus TaxID=1919 RepID=UPI00382A7D9F